jgi:signal peptide peptidase SppA
MSTTNGVITLGRFLEPMAIERERGRALIAGLLRGAELRTESDVQAAFQGASTGGDGVTAVIPVWGFIDKRPTFEMMFMGGTASNLVAARMRAAMRDPAVKAIVLNIDSPGGVVAGMPELAAEILSMRGQGKPIVGIADSLAASGGYWVLAACDEAIVTPSGLVGSVGCVVMHEDISEMAKTMGVKMTPIFAGDGKVNGNPFEPLSEEARGQLQARVDLFYDMFVAGVVAGRGRGVTQALVRETWGARIVGAKEAVELKMADRVATMEETLGRLTTAQGRTAAMRPRAEGEPPEVRTEAPPVPEPAPVAEAPAPQPADPAPAEDVAAAAQLQQQDRRMRRLAIRRGSSK